MNYPDNMDISALDMAPQELEMAIAEKVLFDEKIREATANFRDAIEKATGVDVDIDYILDLVWDLPEIDAETVRLIDNIDKLEQGE